MSMFERKVWMELRRLREAEEALEAMYERLQGGGADTARSFISSLKTLDERVNRLETLLDRVA